MTVLKDISLKKFNTFQINVLTKNFVEIDKLDDLLLLKPIFATEKYYILGGGSNTLFVEDFEGYILKNNIKGYEIISEDSNEIIIKLGSGENWNEFVSYCTSNGYFGTENLALIPGTIGGAIIQNINAYGAEVSNIVFEVSYLDLQSFQTINLTKEKCIFGYRTSIFKSDKENKKFILSGTFRLKKQSKFNLEFKNTYGGLADELNHLTNGNEPTLVNVRDAIISLRTKKLPNLDKYPNAGSFFVHPIVSKEQFEELSKQNLSNPDFTHYEMPDGKVKLSAGWAVEYAGLKGFRFKTVGVYEKHALILVNYDTNSRESGKDMHELVKIIQDEVYKKWKIELKTEVVIV